MQTNKETFLGIPVGTASRRELLLHIAKRIERGEASTLIAINPEKIMTAQKNETLKRLIHESTFQIPDGVGVLIASRLKKGRIKERITGIDMMDTLVALAEECQEPIFLYGAKEEIVQEAKANLQLRYPDLVIAGALNGYQQNQADVVNRIHESKATMLFVAQGSPRQELWIEEHMNDLPQVRVFQGVGGSLDVWAGKVKRAPALFRKFGLEWLYRLLSEPSRIRRQLVLPVFLLKVLFERKK